VDGEWYYHRISASAPIGRSDDFCRAYCVRTCISALASIIHGDIKGSNILISDRLVACLADFGLAALSYAGQLDTRSASERSLRWLAPEIMDPETSGLVKAAISPESDVYAFGVTVWEIFTGKVPFDDFQHDAAVMNRVLKGLRPPRPTSPESHGLDDNVWQLIQRCWHHDWRQRPDFRSVIRSCMGRNNGSYHVDLGHVGRTIPRTPVASFFNGAPSDALSRALSEWTASYVWRMCTTGLSLSPVYAAPGGFIRPRPDQLLASVHSVFVSASLEPRVVSLAVWYLTRLPVFFGEPALEREDEMRFREELLKARKDSPNSDWELSAVFRLVVLGVMLASKRLYGGHALPNETWHRISQISVPDLKRLGSPAEKLLPYDLSLTEDEWRGWISQLMTSHSSLSSSGFPQSGHHFVTRSSMTDPTLVYRELEKLSQQANAATRKSQRGYAYTMPMPGAVSMERVLNISSPATFLGGPLTDDVEELGRHSRIPFPTAVNMHRSRNTTAPSTFPDGQWTM